MIQVEKKVYRNIDEQVAKNTTDIAKYADIEETVTTLKNDCIAEKENCQEIEDNCNDVLTECQSLVDNWKYYRHEISFSITHSGVTYSCYRIIIISNESNSYTASSINEFINKIVNYGFLTKLVDNTYKYFRINFMYVLNNNILIEYTDENNSEDGVMGEIPEITDSVRPLFEEPAQATRNKKHLNK